MIAAKQLLYDAFCVLHAAAERVTGRQDESRPADLKAAVSVGWETLDDQKGGPSLVVFAATIGELNAIKPLIAALQRAWPGDRLVIFTAQAQYLEAMQAAYPRAALGLSSLREPWHWRRFVRLARPRLAVLAEGPSLHCRFPLRLELPFSTVCLGAGIPLFVANARLYVLTVHSRLDGLENRVFGDLHRAAVRRLYATTDKAKQELIEAGAPAERISVVGDLKFDGAVPAPEPASAELAGLLDRFTAGDGPLLVAGSVNAIDDQQAVIEAWRGLKARHGGAKLVLAPRYVNRPEVMEQLEGFLREQGIAYSRRSQTSADGALEDLLIVDVFGELRAFYSIADIAYVGRNHGVLEPLRFGKPTVVAADWQSHAPPYAIYELLVDRGGLIQVVDKSKLAEAFLKIVEDRDWAAERVAEAKAAIAENSGVAERILESIKAELDGRPKS